MTALEKTLECAKQHARENVRCRHLACSVVDENGEILAGPFYNTPGVENHAERRALREYLTGQCLQGPYCGYFIGARY